MTKRRFGLGLFTPEKENEDLSVLNDRAIIS